MAAVLARAGLGPIVSSQRAAAGRRNRVWLVSTPSVDVAVRFLADGRRLDMERRVLEVVATHGIPVAEVLWAEHEPAPVLVQRRLPGRMLAEVEPTDETCRSLAETLRAIHAVPVRGGFGNLTADLTGEAERLSTWFAGTGHHDLLDRQRPGLVHGDIQPTNVLVGEDGRVSGVLDWEAAKSGPPAFDFGWWDWYSARYGTCWTTEQLLEHYGEVPDGTHELRRLVVRRIEGSLSS